MTNQDNEKVVLSNRRKRRLVSCYLFPRARCLPDLKKSLDCIFPLTVGTRPRFRSEFSEVPHLSRTLFDPRCGVEDSSIRFVFDDCYQGRVERVSTYDNFISIRRMSCMERTPELPKARRTTASLTWDRKRPALFPPTRPTDSSENANPGSATIKSGHSKPLQPHRFRRRLPPEQLSEIGELIKTIDLSDESESI